MIRTIALCSSLAMVTVALDVAPAKPRKTHQRIVSIPSPQSLPPVLREVLTPHPERITRMVGSHDPTGRNRDNSCEGWPTEGDYRVVFHAKGEGRIVRLWMNADEKIDIPTGWQELWIELDGQTIYRGHPLEFFEGRGPWRAPLVLDHPKSSGAYLSWVPFPYAHEAKIRFKGYPQFFQVSYQQGPGASIGPSAEETEAFLRDTWWPRAPAPTSERTIDVDHPEILAHGPTMVTALSLGLDEATMPKMRLRVGGQPSFPASMLFGFATKRTDPGNKEPREIPWPALTSALSRSDPEAHRLVTRTPIPLRAGETLTLETEEKAPQHVSVGLATARDFTVEASGARFVTQYREQYAPGTETTFPVFETSKVDGLVSLLSVLDETAEGIPGNRGFLEGDEMIRLDGMHFPLFLGTGTEDYFNGGWYFWGVHTNPLSGLTRFDVLHDEQGWGYAIFEHSMYRMHVLDPIAARAGMRFGFEAGETGSYAPIFYRTLALGYGFTGHHEIARRRFILDRETQGEGILFGTPDRYVDSALDAEHGEKPVHFPVRAHRGVTKLVARCPEGPSPSTLLLVRGFDQGVAPQSAAVRIDGELVDPFYELYVNQERRLAEDAISVVLTPDDCRDGELVVELDARAGTGPFTESYYEIALYR